MSATDIRRVVLVVLDGLRGELVQQGTLPNLDRLCDQGAWTNRATTVNPSVTAAAMLSLFTGVSPGRHGIGTDGFAIPPRADQLRPISRLLSAARLPTSIHMRRIPLHYRWLAARMKRLAGVAAFESRGRTSSEVLAAARPALEEQRRGLIFMHWPEADQAGHDHGWGSPEYLDAVTSLDHSVGNLVAQLESQRDLPLVIFCADHGGGGIDPFDHESDHPLDITIPILLWGAGVRPGALHDATLLDIPPTVLWALGLQQPSDYEGRPLLEAFEEEAAAA